MGHRCHVAAVIRVRAIRETPYAIWEYRRCLAAGHGGPGAAQQHGRRQELPGAGRQNCPCPRRERLCPEPTPQSGWHHGAGRTGGVPPGGGCGKNCPVARDERADDAFERTPVELFKWLPGNGLPSGTGCAPAAHRSGSACSRARRRSLYVILPFTTDSALQNEQIHCCGPGLQRR